MIAFCHPVAMVFHLGLGQTALAVGHDPVDVAIVASHHAVAVPLTVVVDDVAMVCYFRL